MALENTIYVCQEYAAIPDRHMGWKRCRKYLATFTTAGALRMQCVKSLERAMRTIDPPTPGRVS